ncbi:MAG: cytochrome c peroxidase [Porticoccus sp.]|nr:cytochrome c peroxidase [Porticoccus sp.]
MSLRNIKGSLSILIFFLGVFSLIPVSADPLQQQAQSLFKPLPDKMPGAENDSEALISLGNKLYHDTRLSIDDNQSCASCHNVMTGGDDGEPTSPGSKGSRGGRNSPTVLNAGLQFTQFWDGRAADLIEQAKGPILNPIEMGMPNHEDVVTKLSATEYPALFEQALGKNSLNYDNIALAIAAFERTLITRDRFDDYLKGDSQALTEEEKRGLKSLINNGCAGCHNGVLLGGQTYQKVGIIKPYKNTTDIGLAEITGDASHKYWFKVPTLRNIDLTAPYFHDGQIATLEEAIQTMAELQLGKILNDKETRDITVFLKSLSDTQSSTNVSMVNDH